ncbi:MAG: OmpH family outer membrane protein [Phycisphaerae bacterium]
MIAAVAVAAWGGSRLSAQPGKAPVAGPVGVVDVVRVFDECDQIKDLNQLIKDTRATLAKEAEARQKALADKEAELAAFDPTSADYAARRREFVRMSIEYNVWTQATREDMKRDHFNWTRVVYDEANRAVGEIAAERGLSVILQKREFRPEVITDLDVDKLQQMIHGRGVVWSDAGLDVTDTVIKRMNQKYKERGGRNKLAPASGS